MLRVENILYITTPGAWVHLDHDTVKVEIDQQTRLQAPLIHIGGITCFGNVALSSAILQRCAEEGRPVVLMDQRGRFKARVSGPTSGNVLLRRAQHQAHDDPDRTREIARNVVAGKLQNSRRVLLRAARESTDPDDSALLSDAAQRIALTIQRLQHATTLEQVRGHEGEGARRYFGAFHAMVRADRTVFEFSGRVRRPPIGRINALLSFLYAMLLNDCVAAVEAVGLDPQVGFLHRLRPGRPALALDLMEDLRAYAADRLVLTLVNRGQLRANDFEILPGGAARLSDSARKAVIVAWQQRKQDEVRHQLLGRTLPLGLVPLVQAQMLARHLRSDLESYPPFLVR
ncbi:MAG: subtype I-C CRISPR-associated endonuclease Cas1 [Chloroflexi bacterium]|nr:MAG: subtype I-C CRISPR-associated endonuclease Cas1 [Chloroflexota bacterium]